MLELDVHQRAQPHREDAQLRSTDTSLPSMQLIFPADIVDAQNEVALRSTADISLSYATAGAAVAS